MENIEKCECWIGVLYDYDDTHLVTSDQLKQHINDTNYFAELWNKVHKEKRKTYSLSDYCNKRKSTDLTRFNYCPLCGKKIDWKAIKGGANG